MSATLLAGLAGAVALQVLVYELLLFLARRRRGRPVPILRALLLLPLLAGFLVTLEVGLRVHVVGGGRADPFVPDPILGWRLRAGMAEMSNNLTFPITSNREGLRTAQVSTDKTRPRILCLGDSITFGLGVDDHQAWPQLLQEKLNRRGVEVDVINAGIPAFNSLQASALLDEVGPRYEPDVVVITLLNNEHGVPSYQTLMARGRPVPGVAIKRLLTRSEIYLSVMRWRKAIQRFDQIERASLGWDVARTAAPDGGYEQNLRYLISRARAGGAQPFLVEEALEHTVDHHQVVYPAMPQETISHFQRTLEKVAQQEDVPLLKVRQLPGYAIHSFFPPSGRIHPSKEGHRLMARELGDALLTAGLLPVPQAPGAGQDREQAGREFKPPG